MNWIEESKRFFQLQKPEHFTNYTHCEECAEHDETLINFDVDNIGMEQLGKIGWDPMCFCSVEGKKYYMPALIRLCLETIKSNDRYLEQFLFHLEGDGKNNKLVTGCSHEQREFIASFIGCLMENYATEIEHFCCTDDVLKVYDIWKQP